MNAHNKDQQPVYLTGSAKRDQVCFMVLVLLLLGASPRVRVYYRVAAARVEATQITPQGTRVAVPVPVHLKRAGSIHRSMEEQLNTIEQQIRHYMEYARPLAQKPSGTRLEWVIHYSMNSPKMGQKKVLSFSK